MTRKSLGDCVFLFDTTGIMAEPWAKAGFQCHCYDLKNTGSTVEMGRGAIHRYKWDANEYVACDPTPYEVCDSNKIAFLAAFPPCTDLAVSGARWFKGKGLRKLAQSIGFFAASVEVAEVSGAPYFIENPRSTIATYWRQADHSFHPCHFSGLRGDDSYTKETFLWTGGGFVMPPYDMNPQLEIDTEYIHHQPPGDDRVAIRSATPGGFAIAVHKANAPLVRV